VKVILHLTARPETADRLKAVLLEVARHSRSEKDCISYQILQSASDPSSFTTLEEWTSEAAIDRHMAQPHTQKALAEGVPLLAKEFDLRKFHTVG
jgi:quinol monooxygenase YgiN